MAECLTNEEPGPGLLSHLYTECGWRGPTRPEQARWDDSRAALHQGEERLRDQNHWVLSQSLQIIQHSRLNISTQMWMEQKMFHHNKSTPRIKFDCGCHGLFRGLPSSESAACCWWQEPRWGEESGLNTYLCFPIVFNDKYEGGDMLFLL